VHPEAYPVVEKILADLRRPVHEVMRDAATLKSVDPTRYTSERFGLPTVRDILRELEKPGRDPRPEFKTATFREGIEDLAQLEAGMILEGVVTNVTNFGAFVDVGVHQDGLVHISVMSNKFVRDPREVVKAGDIVKVKVMEVDTKRRRIALSMKLDAPVQPQAPGQREGNASSGRGAKHSSGHRKDNGARPVTQGRGEPKREDGALAEALQRALQSR
jgi:protein Tex